MEIIILILIAIGVLALVITAINDIIVNNKIQEAYKEVIKLQDKIIKNNETIIDNYNTLKEHFNKNITDIAKTFNFYDKRLIALEQRQYKRKKKINNDITASNADDVQ